MKAGEQILFEVKEFDQFFLDTYFNEELVAFTFDLDADLESLFNWNGIGNTGKIMLWLLFKIFNNPCANGIGNSGKNKIMFERCVMACYANALLAAAQTSPG